MLARRVCEQLQREPARRRAACCGGGAERHLAAECERALSAALERGSLTIDSAALDVCARASAEEQQGCNWVTPSQPLPPAACQTLTRGTVTEGGSCRSSLECQSPLHCAGSTPSESGHCAAPAAAGSPCDTGSDLLATYLFAVDAERSHPSCAGKCSLVTHRCEAIGREPGTSPSTASSPIAPGGPPRRAARKTALAGEACQSDFDCRSGSCSEGRCEMRCAVAVARVSASQPALTFRRRAAAR